MQLNVIILQMASASIEQQPAFLTWNSAKLSSESSLKCDSQLEITEPASGWMTALEGWESFN